MNIAQIVGMGKRILKTHSPLILTSIAGVGTLTTAYFAAKGSFKAAHLIRRSEEDSGPLVDPRARFKERAKLVWRCYIPTAVSATTTIICIVGANRMEVKKTLAAQAALVLSQRTYADYRDKIVEEFSTRKDQAIIDKVAEERVKKNPPPPQDVMLTGPGHVLCCELYTGRYFVSDMESLRRAQNDINQTIHNQDYATLEDFYYLIELPRTSHCARLGWNSDKLMELVFSTVMSPDSRPCIAFEYNYIKPI